MSEREVVDLTVRLGSLSLRVTAPVSGPTASEPEPSSPASSRGSFVLVNSEVPATETVDCPPLLRRSAPRSSPARPPSASQAPNPRTPKVSLGSPGLPVCTQESEPAPSPQPLTSSCSTSYPSQGFGPGLSASSSSPSSADLSASFPPVSLAAISLGRGIADPTGFRVQRAWTAGLWAGAVLQGRARAVARTPPLDLRNRLYIVLRAPGLDGPHLYNNFAAYRRAVQNHTTDSVSHGFASLAEVRIYCAGAGVAFPAEP